MEYAEHERLFEQIRGKLNELGGTKKPETPSQIDFTEMDSSMDLAPAPHPERPTEKPSERLEKMQFQLKKSQEELFTVRHEMEEKIRYLETLSYTHSDLSRDIKRQSEQLEVERTTNSKLSSDLAKSLELNLKLQYEIEEIRARAQAVIDQEKKHNMFLQEKLKTQTHELELAQAFNNETRNELNKASEEVLYLTESLTELEDHAQKQSDVLKNLSEVAEKKIIELKVGFDKKSAESQDSNSQLQQSFSQIQVLRQENSALREYINKMSALFQQQQGHAQPAQTRPS